MKYDISKLFTELDLKEIKEQVKRFEVFEFERNDKTHGIRIRISARRCDNGIWQDNYLCSIDGERYKSGFQGFGSPYQKADFLKLTYDEIINSFYHGLSLEQQSETKQLSIFALL